jgi:hypothetical protein
MLLSKVAPYGWVWSSPSIFFSSSRRKMPSISGKARSVSVGLLVTMSRSILVTTWGSMLFSGAGMLYQFTNEIIISTVVLNISWVAMVTGFSCVLYSRLHLVNPGKKVLRATLAAIIMDALLFHGPVIASTIASNIHYSAIAVCPTRGTMVYSHPSLADWLKLITC